MSRWLDAARKAAPAQGASANSAKRAKSPPIGTNGTNGTGVEKRQNPTTNQREDYQEAFEERAAILEFDGEFTREEAERRAAVETGWNG